MSLSREQRIIVNKLASLLRIAEALDAGHNKNSINMQCRLEKNNLFVSIPGMKDLVMKKRILPAETDMFEDIYGLNAKLEET